MNNFEERLEKMLGKQNEPKKIADHSLNKDFTLFQEQLSCNINNQYKKEWKKLSKDCKIKNLLEYCNINNISNYDYLKKYINKLEIDYQQEEMKISNINNILKIENSENSSLEYQIINLKETKSNKKSLSNQIETELVEDI